MLFQAMLSAVEPDADGRVRSVIVTNKNGLSRLRATNFIDCTGDADLCAWAGAEFHKGSESGELMPATHCFVLANVDGALFQTKYENGRRLMGNHPETPICQTSPHPWLPRSVDLLAPNAFCVIVSSGKKPG